MNNFLEIIQKWHDRSGSNITYDNIMYYLIELFQELKTAGLDKNYLPQIGKKLLGILDIEMEEYPHMIYQRMLAKEINAAFNIVYRDVEEIKDEPTIIQQIKPVDDGDVYYDNSEPIIDLRNADLGEISFDQEFIKELGIDNE